MMLEIWVFWAESVSFKPGAEWKPWKTEAGKLLSCSYLDRKGKQHTWAWWCYHMEALSVSLALYVGNPSMTGGFHSQRASSTELWCFLWCAPKHLNKQVNKYWSRWWFQTPWWSCDVIVMQFLPTIIQVGCKIYFIVRPFSLTDCWKNVAPALETELLCHVQNFVCITVRIWMRPKQNFHPIWLMNEILLVKSAPPKKYSRFILN